MGRLAAGLLCLLVLVSGCSALLDDGPAGAEGPTATVTPAPVPDDTELAPGVTRRGVEAPARLAQAHAEAVGGRSFVLTASRTVRYANDTLRSGLWVRVAVDDRAHLAEAATAGPEAPVFLGRPPANATFWSNGSTHVRKLTRDGRTTYNEFGPPASGVATRSYWTGTVPFGGRQATPESFYRTLFESVAVGLAGETRSDATATYRLVGERVTNETFRFGATDVRDVRLVATVTDRGIVRNLSLTYVGEVEGETVTVSRTVRYRKVGETTVERPDWFERAVGQESEGRVGTPERQSSAGEEP